MRKQKISMKTIFCVNSACFGDTSSASRHLLALASQGKRVTVTRQVTVERAGS